MDKFSEENPKQESTSQCKSEGATGKRYKDSPIYGYSRDIDWTNKKHKPYGTRKKNSLFFLYLFSILFWMILIIFICPTVGILGWIILFIPVIVFTVAILNLDNLSPIMEEYMLRTNILSAGILIILPLLTFITQGYRGDHHAMTLTVLFAIIFTLLSMIDIWTSEKWHTFVIHLRSIFQTAALTLIIFALFLYYSNMESIPFCHKK